MMDRKEAIKELQSIRRSYIYITPNTDLIAIDMAIESLSAEQKEEDLAEDIARRMATIIENEQDMRVILKNASTETSTDQQKHQLSEETSTNESTDLISRKELLDRIKAINSLPWGDELGNAVKLVWSTEEVKRLVEKAPSAMRKEKNYERKYVGLDRNQV